MGRPLPAVQKDMEWPDPFLREGEEMVVGKQMRFLLAENLQRDGRLREAADQFRQFIRDYPDDTCARVKLGMVLVETGEYQDAERVLRELLRIEPGKIQGHFLLSAALFHQAERSAKNPGEKGKMLQQFQEAADQARQALDRQPNHGFAHVYLGLALRNLGRWTRRVRPGGRGTVQPRIGGPALAPGRDAPATGPPRPGNQAARGRGSGGAGVRHKAVGGVEACTRDGLKPTTTQTKRRAVALVARCRGGICSPCRSLPPESPSICRC